jgi:peptide/nickel transport system substrate-binding protein
MIESMRLMIDDDARHEAMFRFHRILHEEQPYLFLFAAPDLGLYDKRYRGVRFYPLRPGYDLTEWFLPERASGS